MSSDKTANRRHCVRRIYRIAGSRDIWTDRRVSSPWILTVTIDLQKESRIIYNLSLDVIHVDLESNKYCDVDGNKIYGSVSLRPFESKILISCDFEIP